MARNRQNLNIIYISDRMRETLRPIASCALTAVVAPMGYGKTTAVRWFLAEQAKAGAVVLQASIYSDNRSIFSCILFDGFHRFTFNSYDAGTGTPQW